MATSVETLQGYRDAAVAARHALATGQRVEDVWRDGRRMRLSKMTLAELNDYIARLDQEIAEAQADAESRPRRRAISFGYRD